MSIREVPAEFQFARTTDYIVFFDQGFHDSSPWINLMHANHICEGQIRKKEMHVLRIFLIKHVQTYLFFQTGTKVYSNSVIVRQQMPWKVLTGMND